MRFPEILNGEMPLWLLHDALLSLFLYRWMALVSLKSSGRYLIRDRCFHSLELLIFFLGFLQCWGIIKRAKNRALKYILDCLLVDLLGSWLKILHQL